MDLDELEKETKLERKRIARENLTWNLNKIRSRTEAKGERFPDDTFERLKVNEIWKQVLPFLNDPEDVKSAYFSCQSFRPHLRERRIADLLPNVVRIIVDGDYIPLGIAQITIRNMRPVSKRLKRGLESEFFERRLNSTDWHLDYGDFIHPNTLGCCEFYCEDQVEMAFSALGENDSGHCFIRHLQIFGFQCYGSRNFLPDDEDYDRRINYFNRLLQFLDLHGHAVWGLWCTLHSITYSSNNYEGLREVVQRTPNLRALTVERKFGFSSDEDHHKRFQEELSNYPFPYIKSLKLVEFRFSSSLFNFYHPLISHILRRNDHIKTLYLSIDYEWDGPEIRETLKVIEKEGAMENLELERFGGPFYSWSILSQVQWPLKVLHLSLDGPDEYRSFKNNELFPELNRFGNTLEKLNLCADIEKSVFSWGFCETKLDLPHLKKLHVLRDENEVSEDYFERGSIDLSSNYIEFADLVGLKSLEKLNVCFSSRPVYLPKYFKAFPRFKQLDVGYTRTFDRTMLSIN